MDFSLGQKDAPKAIVEVVLRRTRERPQFEIPLWLSITMKLGDVGDCYLKDIGETVNAVVVYRAFDFKKTL